MSHPRTTRRTTGRARLTRGVLAAVVAAAGLTSACADAPSSPAAAPALAKGGKAQDTVSTATSTSTSTVLATAASAEGLLRTTRLAAPVTTSFVVGPLGGVLALPGTGLTVYVPALAHPTGPVTITATALAGDLVAYEFGPHGTTFALPLVAIQDLAATNWLSRGTGATYDVGYFSTSADLNLDARTALVRELLPRSIDALDSRLVFQVSHFSGYMVSWGVRAD